MYVKPTTRLCCHKSFHNLQHRLQPDVTVTETETEPAERRAARPKAGQGSPGSHVRNTVTTGVFRKKVNSTPSTLSQHMKPF